MDCWAWALGNRLHDWLWALSSHCKWWLGYWKQKPVSNFGASLKADSFFELKFFVIFFLFCCCCGCFCSMKCDSLTIWTYLNRMCERHCDVWCDDFNRMCLCLCFFFFSCYFSFFCVFDAIAMINATRSPVVAAAPANEHEIKFQWWANVFKLHVISINLVALSIVFFKKFIVGFYLRMQPNTNMMCDWNNFMTHAHRRYGRTESI